MPHIPQVSIIMPTYNRAYILEKAIKSVLNQTFGDFEFLIVDDCSTDNTADIVSDYQKADDRIKYIKLTAKKGANAARNAGINSASCPLIAFQDSDDEWFVEKLEQQVNLMRSASTKVGIVYTGFNKVFPNKTLYLPDPRISQKEGNILKNLLKENFIGMPSVLVRKECFDKVGCFDESLPRLQDWDFFIRVAQYYEFKVIDHPLFISFMQKDSISTDCFKLFKASLIVIKKYYHLLQKEKVSFDHPVFKVSYIIVWFQVSMRRIMGMAKV